MSSFLEEKLKQLTAYNHYQEVVIKKRIQIIPTKAE